MPGYLAALTMVLLVGMVVTRILMMKRKGIAAMQFGKLDKTDFLLPPFALFYFYLVFAHAFHWQSVSMQEFFHCAVIAWIGVLFCLMGLIVFLWSLISFGTSFRVGIDTQHPDKLITTGVFAHNRNPIYLAFGLVLIGQFLIFSSWVLLVYLIAAVWLFHRQVLREEDYLKQHYGEEYLAYCKQVRRYL
jgi:protein-S-isoprenylcysteine O-methyltransferase Ste14